MWIAKECYVLCDTLTVNFHIVSHSFFCFGVSHLQNGGEGEGLVEQLRSELRSTKQKLELAEHALLTPEVLTARKLRSTKLQDMEESFRGTKASNPVPGRLTPVSVLQRRKEPIVETEERKRARLKKARETPLKEFKPWESVAAGNSRGSGDAWQ